jgi:hypothetical protein
LKKATRFQEFKRKRSLKTFLGFELGITVLSLVVAWFIGTFLYGWNPGFFMWIAANAPQQPIVTLTAFGAAYAIGAGLFWLTSNITLFVTGLRTL